MMRSMKRACPIPAVLTLALLANCGSSGGGSVTADGSVAASGSVTADASVAVRQSDSASPATGGMATCQDIVDCIGACPSSNTTCPDACNAKGSPKAQSDVLALLQCLVNNCSGSDTSCAGTACAGEVNACAQQSAGATLPSPSTGTGSSPSASGSVPANLVGTWSFVSSDGAMIYVFQADGSAFFSERLEFTDGYICNVTEENMSGKVAFSGNTMALNFTGGNDVSGPCGTVAVPKPLAPSQSIYTWRLGTDSQGQTALFINSGSGEAPYVKG